MKAWWPDADKKVTTLEEARTVGRYDGGSWLIPYVIKEATKTAANPKVRGSFCPVQPRTVCPR